MKTKEHYSFQILLVEDDENDVELILMALEKSGINKNITTINDSVEIIEYLNDAGNSDNGPIHLPDLIILDLKMPKLSGLELLKEIKSCDQLKNIPVVIISSSNYEKDIEMAYRLGANSYVVKPVDYKKFVSTVSKVGMYWVQINQPSVNFRSDTELH